MPATATRLISAAELLRMGDIGRCELIYGELVMMSPAGFEHGMVASRIGRLLGEFVDADELGVVLAAETGFKLESKPDLVRAPDAGFIRKQRLAGKMPRWFFNGAPDLAVEVISPQDSKREVAEKVNRWLAHGTVSVWVADPAAMTLTTHRMGRKPIRLSAAETLENEPALPGFRMPLAKVFKRP